MAGVNAAKVRKDLSYLGSYGTRGVGYDVEYLLFQISRELGLTQDWPVVIVGIGNLGHALANYGGFSARGFRVVALRRRRPQPRWARRSATCAVRHLDDLPAIAAEHDIAIGIIATPAGVGPGRRRPAGGGGRHVDPQLRPRRDLGAPPASRSARSTCPSSCRSSASTSSAGRAWPRPAATVATVG